MLPIEGDVAAQKERSCEDRLGYRELRGGLRVFVFESSILLELFESVRRRSACIPWLGSRVRNGKSAGKKKKKVCRNSAD